MSKQTNALVIAISARRDVVSLYVDGSKYILEEIPVVLAKANQALATLDKYRMRLDQIATRLMAMEFEGGVLLHDVLVALQRYELVARMAVEIERFIVELGREGRLIEMQLEETMMGVAGDKTALLQDYLVESSDETLAGALDELSRLPHQELLDFGRLAELLGSSGRSTRLTSACAHVGTARLDGSPAFRSSPWRTWCARSTGSKDSWPLTTSIFNRSTAWMPPGRRRFARVSAACRKSISLTVPA